MPIPPTCLVTILGDNSVPDYVQTLNYSVLLRGALIGGFNEDSMICIIRTMSKEGTGVQFSHIYMYRIIDYTCRCENCMFR